MKPAWVRDLDVYAHHTPTRFIVTASIYPVALFRIRREGDE